MKKLVAIILIIVGGVYIFTSSDTDKVENLPADKAESFRPDASSATFVIDDETVALNRGKSDTVEMLSTTASGELNNDNKLDTVVLLAQSAGGSGIFIYAAAYVSGPVGYKGTNAVFLGDRVAPQSITIANGVATVRYLDRGADEPLAAEPTIPSSKQFVYRNGEFQER